MAFNLGCRGRELYRKLKECRNPYGAQWDIAELYIPEFQHTILKQPVSVIQCVNVP